MRQSHVDFILQQGFPVSDADERLFEALMFQPRVISLLGGIGVLFQSSWFYAALAATLWWSAIVATHNIYDALYNVSIAKPRGLPLLGAAPAPRRFAMGMAGTIALLIAIALLANATITAWVFEAFFMAGALSAVVASRCMGAAVYHLLRLPWQVPNSPVKS